MSSAASNPKMIATAGASYATPSSAPGGTYLEFTEGKNGNRSARASTVNITPRLDDPDMLGAKPELWARGTVRRKSDQPGPLLGEHRRAPSIARHIEFCEIGMKERGGDPEILELAGAGVTDDESHRDALAHGEPGR